MRKKNLSLNLLKCLTMLLIINSHSDVLYPEKLSFFASGGGIGNELFFLMSGYLFRAKDDFKGDLRRRFVRLYVPAYIMIAVTALFGRIQIDGVLKAIRVFLWPTQFWFVGAIFLYSILMYRFIDWGIEKKGKLAALTVILAMTDVLLYIFAIPDKSQWIVEDVYLAFIPFRSIYSLFSFVFGYYLKKNREVLEQSDERAIIGLAILFFAGFYGFKLALNKGIVPMSAQIVSQPLTVLSAVFIFMSFVKADMNPQLEGTRLGNWINCISALSLESYLVQFLIIASVSRLSVPFPGNMVFCCAIVLICAKGLQYLSSKAEKLCDMAYSK